MEMSEGEGNSQVAWTEPEEECATIAEMARATALSSKNG
jgi:hypothetical protein